MYVGDQSDNVEGQLAQKDVYIDDANLPVLVRALGAKLNTNVKPKC